MIIEKMKLEDLDEVSSIENECFQDPWPKEAFKRDLDNDIADLYVLKDKDKVIGYYDVWYMFENADISTICIRKDYQGKKLGEYLLKDLIIRCIKKDVEFLHLEVRVDNNKAINLYKKFGFEKLRIRKGYYNGTDGIDMMKGLIGLSEKDFSD